MNFTIKAFLLSIFFLSCLEMKQSFADIIVNSEIEDTVTTDSHNCKQQGASLVGDCTQQFTENDETISIVENGNIILRGITDTGDDADAYVAIGANAGIYVADDAELSNLKIIISANDGEGIIQNMTNKSNPAVYIGKSNYLESLNITSGLIKSQDTSFFIVDSGSSETILNISSGATIQGARAAIRQDVDVELDQVSDSNDGTSSTPSGYLKMTINNAGNIISDATLLSPDSKSTTDTANAGMAFRLGNNKVERDVTVNNTGTIEGNFLMGTLTFDKDEANKDSYVKSSFTLVNDGLIKAATFFVDYNNNISVVNNEDGTITMEDREYFYDDTGSYGILGEQAIRLYAKDSQFTNYGTVNGSVTTYSDESKINLLKGSYSGRINYAGTLRLGDDLTSDSLQGNINTSRNFYSDTYNTILDIGGTVKNLKKNGETHLVSDVNDGSLIVNTGAYSGTNTISVTGNTESKSFGRLNMEGRAVVEADTTKLNINLSSGAGSYAFLEEGVEYIIIDGNADESGNDVNKVDDANISVNGITGNTYGLLKFITSANDEDVDGNNSNLVLYVDRAAAEDFTDDELATEIYEAIIDIGSTSTGKLLEFQAYLDSLTSDAEIEAALRSAGPVNAGDLELATLTPIFNFLETTNSRLDYFFDHSNGKNKDGYSKQVEYIVTNDEFLSCFTLDETNNKYVFNKDIEFCNCLFKEEKEDDIVPRFTNENIAIWTQAFGTYGKQKSTRRNDGYRTNIYGATIGTDKKINENSIFGAAFSFAQSDVKSINSLQKTGISSYQLNVYGGQSFGNDYFWDVILGYTLNRYQSQRLIPSIDTTARSNYDGSNYFAQARVGKEFKNVKGSKINIIPELSSTFVTTNIQDYQERDAGTMNLYVHSNTDDFLEGRVGINANKEDSVKINNIEIPTTYRTHLSYGYNFQNQNQVTVSNFVGRSNVISHASGKIGAGSWRAGVGIDIHQTNSTILSIDYLVDRRRNFTAHSGVAKVRYQF